MTAKHLVLAILSVVLIPVSSVVHGQDPSTGSGQAFPTRPVRILVSSPGGTSDIVGRSMQPVLIQRLGQTVIIQNSPGLSGAIVAKAVPDGYTVLIEGGNFWTQHLIEPTPYDFLKDFAPVTLTTIATSLLVVHPSVPAKSARELIALAKAQPGKLNYGSSGVGSGAHLNMELFKAMAGGVDIVHIPYKGSGVAIADLLGGQIQVMLLAGNQGLPLVRAGKLRALGVASLVPSPLVPDLPLISETGLPGYETINRTAIFVPAKTPGARINLWNREIRHALEVPQVAKGILAGGYEPKGSTPEELAAMLKAEIETTAKLVKSIGIRY